MPSLQEKGSNGVMIPSSPFGRKSHWVLVMLKVPKDGNFHPRWVRINTLRTSLQELMSSTFVKYVQKSTLSELKSSVSQNPENKVFYIDQHIPDLIAFAPREDLPGTDAYKNGLIILQDKASCFPAYLLDPCLTDGNVIDTCAAPGNKTTHLAAILKAKHPTVGKTIRAFERDKTRALTLQKMVDKANAAALVHVQQGQDFLRTEPGSEEFKNVGALLLDPSCSGSGIIGRDDLPKIVLPSNTAPEQHGKSLVGKKRKRSTTLHTPAIVNSIAAEDEEQEVGETLVAGDEETRKERLRSLAGFQLKLLTHAFQFPSAKKITYSTCSVHVEENENVVQAAIQSDVGRRRGWRVLRREEQVEGMQHWPIRGIDGDKVVREACIRANKADEHGTMGFFVCGFVRDRKDEGSEESRQVYVSEFSGEEVESEEWCGFSDDDFPPAGKELKVTRS